MREIKSTKIDNNLMVTLQVEDKIEPNVSPSKFTFQLEADGIPMYHPPNCLQTAYDAIWWADRYIHILIYYYFQKIKISIIFS